MTLALQSHQATICATLAFTVAILLPFWFTSPLLNVQFNPLNRQAGNTTLWTFASVSGGSMSLASILIFVTACISVACVGIGLLALIFGSWYVQRSAAGNESKCLLFLTSICIFICFLLSGGTWAIMLTINKWLYSSSNLSFDINISEFSYSLWINLGATTGYLYAFILSLMAFCKGS